MNCCIERRMSHPEQLIPENDIIDNNSTIIYIYITIAYTNTYEHITRNSRTQNLVEKFELEKVTIVSLALEALIYIYSRVSEKYLLNIRD